MRTKLVRTRLTTLALASVLGTLSLAAAQAGTIPIRDTPLFISDSVAPLNMLVVGRDHKLYYEAYNDASDLNGDGVIDTRFNPQLTYYGYFDSAKCYTHNGSMFVPAGAAGTLNACSSQWSGNWLNYMTTARIDALRKVLYGGTRFTDSDSSTVLERTHIPQDAHSWGKEYTSTAVDGYDISQYTPFSQPSANTRHLFANTTLLNSANQLPLLRVLQSQTYRIWEWVSIERPVAGSRVIHGGNGPTVTPTDYTVRVEVCTDSMPEANCKLYPNGHYKPTGLLHDYGENDTMLFGLITGSYQSNTQGGVLRKPVRSFRDEVNNTTGQFLLTSATTSASIIRTLERLKTVEFGGSYEYSCGWASASRPINNGECRMWGNPVGEMMYETLRYFAGKGVRSDAFNYTTSGSVDAGLGLTKATWDNPYVTHPTCSKPFATVISDINPSYDTDKVPGSTFESYTGDITGLNAGNLGQTIWNNEGSGTRKHFIGQSGSTYDGAPTAKDVTSFGNVRGLSPEEPTKQGGYYAASMAYYGNITDLNTATGTQKMQTFAVALASPLPKIEIPVGGRKITLVPFAKSVAGSGISAASGSFQPTNQIVDFYVESLAADGTSGSFRVNFEDVEQGADHDMDAIVRYQYTVTGDSVAITLTSEYAAGGITQHLGYIISGTTRDGIYLEVRDQLSGDGAPSDVDYFLDTPPTFTGFPPAPSSGAGTWDDNVALPFTATRTFTPGATDGATLMKDPLWYAAKWGGFKDSNKNNLPDIETEWNEDPVSTDPLHTPDNYFLVTNALTLKDQLSEAFDAILKRTGAASSASVNSGTINEETRIYQAQFTTGDWSGNLIAMPVLSDDPATPANEAGQIGDPVWNAASEVPAAADRNIFTVNTNGTAVPFDWDEIDATRKSQLAPSSDGLGERRLNYLRGDRTYEVRNGGTLRDRNAFTVLGDFVSSSPVYVAAPRAFYLDSLENKAYSAFKASNKDRQKMIYAGANDGMLHAFDAETGAERWAYIPSPVFKNLHELTKVNYQHKYFVDGPVNVVDAYVNNRWKTVLTGGLNNGGQGVYALDVTDPAADTEAEAADLLMWEFTDADDLDLGYTFSRPAIARMRDGNWYAVFGNGYNNTAADGRASTTGNGVLYLVNLTTKAVRKLNTGVGMSADPLAQSRPNGLASPAVVDLDDDGNADYVYVGDLFGNMWKVNLTDTNPANWGFAFASAGNPAPLFVAQDSSNRRQPITTRPQVGEGPRGEGMMVLFGTGKFLETNDRVVSQLTPQTFYGIWDLNTAASSDAVSGRSALTQQTIDYEGNVTLNGETTKVRVTSENAVSTNRGWYLDLVSPGPTFRGEMSVTNSVLRNRRVLFTTLIPSEDPCAYGGTSWLMELDYLNGSRVEESPFDLNGDGEFSEDDFATINVNGSTSKVPTSGVQSDNGIWSQPAFLSSGEDEWIYVSSSNDKDGNGPCDGPLGCFENGVPGYAYGRQSWRQIR